MADNPVPCSNCGHERYTNSPYCPFCGARDTAERRGSSGWQVAKAIILAIVAIPFAALGGCAACIAAGMGTMTLPAGLDQYGFAVSIILGLVVFFVCLAAILRQVRF